MFQSYELYTYRWARTKPPAFYYRKNACKTTKKADYKYMVVGPTQQFRRENSMQKCEIVKYSFIVFDW